MIDLSNRVIAITGGGRGLGRAYALWMARRGAAIVVNNRWRDPASPSVAVGVVEEIVAGGGRAVADHHGIAEPIGARGLADTALSAFGRIDGLVCNAAISLVETPLEEASESEIAEVVRINLSGTINPVNAMLPALRQGGAGRIVVTTSHIGLYGRPGSTIYGATKLGVVGFARSLALELADGGVGVNVVAPGAVTQISSNLGADFVERAAPERVAPLVGWLCSESCRESGAIFTAMGGKARRVRFLESAIADLDVEEVSAWQTAFAAESYEDEPASAVVAGQRLMPGERRFARP